jgi:hypothetical protein
MKDNGFKTKKMELENFIAKYLINIMKENSKTENLKVMEF